MVAAACSFLSTRLAIVDLPAPESPVSQRMHGLWPLSRERAALVDVDRLPVDVVRAAQREVQQPGADRVVGDPVDRG